MKVYIPHNSGQSMGGGYGFLERFKKYTQHSTVESLGEAEVVFVANPMTAGQVFDGWDTSGLPVVVRLDNIPEERNNRGTAAGKLERSLSAANYVIYQSRWAQWYYELVYGETSCPSKVIHNGVEPQPYTEKEFEPSFLYVRSSRGENKGWYRARSLFLQAVSRFGEKEAKLTIAGKFGRSSLQYNFDFPSAIYHRLNINYIGVVPQDQVPYKDHCFLLAPFFDDACSNTILEAMSWGCVPIYDRSGGTKEIVGWVEKDEMKHIHKRAGIYHNNFDTLEWSKKHYSKYRKDCFERIKDFNIKDKIAEYDGVIEEVNG